MYLRLYFIHIVLFLVCFCVFVREIAAFPSVNGRYTRNIKSYQLTLPRKLTTEGKFVTFSIPHFFDHDFSKRKRKRSLDDPSAVHYGVMFNGAKHHLQLWPNHAFLSPNLIFEHRDPREKVQNRKIRTLSDSQICHFTGTVRGHPGSRVALSTCDGLAGYIMTNEGSYFIEPINEHVPNEKGQLLHLVYQRSSSPNADYVNHCGTTSNWEDAWGERFKYEFLHHTRCGRNKQTRGLHSVHRYLETLIVCDKKFIQYHEKGDVQTYVLTVMNMVADFYHDASSGNQMDVVVVRVIYLDKEEEEIDLIINPNADDTLGSFCKWQQAANTKDVKNPNHHDIAVLLTRHDICSDNLTNCGLMGLAYVAAACTSNKPCAINEDGGLVLGIVVAHEMGHVMGCSHDKEDESGCKSQDEKNSFYVMAPYVHLDTTKWSTCSRTYITTFFDNDLGECLNDEPETSSYNLPDVLPGVMYDADYQCGLVFPESHGVCPMNKEKFCELLVCKTNSSGCVTLEEPPADGTKCGENKWCYDMKCVEMGERPEGINGGWGEWGAWTDCSRTCGGGVAYSERECDNPVPKNKGRYCLGERKKVKICNTTPCEKGSKSFRAVQCSEHDSKPFKGTLHTWEPWMQKDEPCVLYCINEKRIYAKLEPRCKDGTSCKPGSKNMCVAGVCKKVGCDYVLDSDAVEDECGICKGDGTQCKIVSETFKGHTGHGYVKVTTIPKGSKKITITELESSQNSIAISAVDEKKFFLNGDFTEERDGTKDINGVDGLYTHPEPDKESLFIDGPLLEAIVFFVVFYRDENKGYQWSYAEPAPQSTYQPRYHWEFVEWGDCSVRCGGGVESAEPDCLEEKAGKVTPSFCVGVEKPPPMTRKCNEQPCKTKWRVGQWGKCSACKFQSGVRIREVDCVMESPMPGADDILEEDDKCSGPRPGTRELCNSHKTCSRVRRNVDGLPVDMLQHLWYQTFEDFVIEKLPELEEEFKYHRLRQVKSSGSCADKNEKPKEKMKVQVGSLVKDKADKIKLVVIPMKQSHMTLNVSDNSFETMGDQLSDSLDTKHKTVFTGKEAAERLKEFQHHKNSTKEEDKRNL